MKADGREDEINMRYDKPNRRESQMSKNDAGASQNTEQEELEVNEKQLQGRESEMTDETETLTTISCISPACDTSEVDRDLETKMEAVQGELGNKVADGLETNVAEGLGTNIAVVRGDLGTKMTTGDSQVEEVLGENVRGDLGTSKLTVDQLKEPGNESDPPSKPSSPGNEDDEEPVADEETNVQEVLRNSWTNDDASQKETVDKNSLFFANKGNSRPEKRMLARRASSPNIMIPTTKAEPVLNKPKTGFSGRPRSLTSPQDPSQDGTSISPPRKRMLARQAISSPNLMSTQTVPGTDKPKLSFGRPPSLTSTHEPSQDNTSTGQQRKRMLTRRASSPNLMSAQTEAVKLSLKHRHSLTRIQELSHSHASTEISPPSEKPTPRMHTRRSSIAVMTGVVNPFVPGSPSPKSLFHSLPELSGQSSSGPDFEKYNFRRRGSIQENQIQDSLRKINRRLTTPLTGAQLEKRLQAHRVGAAALQTRVACTSENKAPDELDMSDLQDCRYIRSRVSK